jgi:hypothetical protein
MQPHDVIDAEQTCEAQVTADGFDEPLVAVLAAAAGVQRREAPVLTADEQLIRRRLAEEEQKG